MESTPAQHTILGFEEISKTNIQSFIDKIITSGADVETTLNRNNLLQILNVFLVFDNHFKNEKLWEAIEKFILKVYEQYNQKTTEIINLQDLELIVRCYSKVSKPSAEITIFIERNMLRMSKVNQADSKSIVMICNHICHSNFSISNKMKTKLCFLIQLSLSWLQTGECFAEGVEYIGKMDNTYLQNSFRKINGVCIGIYCKNYKSFTIKDQIKILKGFEQTLIHHSTIKKSANAYIMDMTKEIHKLGLNDTLNLLELACNFLTIKSPSSIFEEILKRIRFLILEGGKEEAVNKISITMFKYLMVQMQKCGQYCGKLTDLKSFIRAFCVIHKNKFTDKDKTSIIIPALKVMSFPENVIEAMIPSVPELNTENLEKYITVQSNLFGNTLDNKEEEKIINNLKEIESSKLPNVIKSMVDSNISSFKIWNCVRESLVNHYKNKGSNKMIAESLISMNQYMRESSFLKDMRPFVLNNLDQFDLESLIKIRNNFCEIQKVHKEVQSEETQKQINEYYSMITCFDMRIVGMMMTFGTTRRIRLRPSTVAGRLIHSATIKPKFKKLSS